MKAYSQYKQDEMIDHLFEGKKGGTFLDIGAHDGISFSNTYLFEKERGWNGLCIEPMPSVFKSLERNRKCILENCCIADKEMDVTFREIIGPEMLSGILDFFDEKHLERINMEISRLGEGSYKDYKLKSKVINDLLEKYKLYKIDYCSIDTEGAELKIIKSIDFTKFDITVFSIENNNHDDQVRNFLREHKYVFVESEGDDFYVKEGTPRIGAFKRKVGLYKLEQKIKRRLS